MTIPKSVAGVIFSKDRSSVLLILRRDVPVWVLPGGGIEKNESAERAMIREILEETGFEVKINRLVGVYTPINRLARLTHLYECSIELGTASTSNETKDVRFFSIQKLPPMPPPYEEWIHDALQTRETVHRLLSSVNYWNLFKNLVFHPYLVFRFFLSRLGFPINS